MVVVASGQEGPVTGSPVELMLANTSFAVLVDVFVCNPFALAVACGVFIAAFGFLREEAPAAGAKE